MAGDAGGAGAGAAARRVGAALGAAAERARPRAAAGAAWARRRGGQAVAALRPAAGAAAARLRPQVEAVWVRSGGAEAWLALPTGARSAAPYVGVALAGAVVGLSVARRGAERRFRKECAALKKRVSELESTQHPLLH